MEGAVRAVRSGKAAGNVGRPKGSSNSKRPSSASKKEPKAVKGKRAAQAKGCKKRLSEQKARSRKGTNQSHHANKTVEGAEPSSDKDLYPWRRPEERECEEENEEEEEEEEEVDVDSEASGPDTGRWRDEAVPPTFVGR